jgi:MFS family permease
VVLGADTLSAVGTGMTLPFLVVYLHRGHGFSFPLAGLAVALVAAASFAGNPVGGWLADRCGARNALATGLAVAALAAGWLATFSANWEGLAAAALAGFGVAVAWPAQDALLAILVAEEHRVVAFGLRHATLNLGLGVGSLLASLIVGLADSNGFTLLYGLDALSFLLAIPLLLAVRIPPRPASPEEPHTAGYRAVFADRSFRRLWLLVALLVTLGYGQFGVTLPAFATGRAGLEPEALGLVFAANTVAIVGVQLVSLRLLAGRRRTDALAVLAMCWAATWVIVALAGAMRGPYAAPLLATAAVVFAVGETLLAPTLPALVNDLAPEQLRGRYNGAATLAYTTGFVTGPLLGGLLLEPGGGLPLFALLAVGCLAAAAYAFRLDRHLPERVNRSATVVAQPAMAEGAPA